MKYPAVGTCIYCGATAYSEDPAILAKQGHLTDEHIVPFCLNGDLELPAASCHRCQNATSRVETALFEKHGSYRAARVFHDYASRRKGPKTVPLYVGTDPETMQRIDLAPDEGPRWITTAEWPGPRLLAAGRVYGQPSRMMVAAIPLDQEAEDWAGGQKQPFATPTLRLDYLLQFMAKVAHSYATAKMGMGAFHPLLTEFISARDVPSAHIPFGCFGAAVQGQREGRYHLDLRLQDVGAFRYVVVDVSVLATICFPTHSVVVGYVPWNANNHPAEEGLPPLVYGLKGEPPSIGFPIRAVAVPIGAEFRPGSSAAAADAADGSAKTTTGE